MPRKPAPARAGVNGRTLLESAAAPIAHVLGFRGVADVEFFENAAAATLRSDNVVVALIVTKWAERLDPWWRTAVVEAGRRGATWCLLFNGSHLRLLNAARVFFATVCRVRSRLCRRRREDVVRDAHAHFGRGIGLHSDSIRLVSRRASSIVGALRVGRVPVAPKRCPLEASEHVLRALVARPHAQPLTDVFEQALTIVYRMLFLFCRSRSLVPSWHPIYRSSYSLERLSEQALRADASGIVGWTASGCTAGSRRMSSGRSSRHAI